MKINITAIVKSKPEHLQETKKMLTEMASTSRKEQDCIQYDLHQDKENANIFIFHEIWESEEGLALHETQPYFMEFISQASELLAEPVLVYETNKIV